jgi:hypothetical protein
MNKRMKFKDNSSGMMFPRIILSLFICNNYGTIGQQPGTNHHLAKRKQPKSLLEGI